MNKERSEWELKEKQNELAYQVTDAYYKLILERKLLDLALEQSRLSERYLKQTEVFVELGLKSASDLQEVKARREEIFIVISRAKIAVGSLYYI